MVYCAGKRMEKSRSFYGFKADKLLGISVEHSKNS